MPKIFTCPLLFLPVPDRRMVSNFHPRKADRDRQHPVNYLKASHLKMELRGRSGGRIGGNREKKFRRPFSWKKNLRGTLQEKKIERHCWRNFFYTEGELLSYTFFPQQSSRIFFPPESASQCFPSPPPKIINGRPLTSGLTWNGS